MKLNFPGVLAPIIILCGLGGCPDDPDSSLTTGQFCERACVPLIQCWPDEFGPSCVTECIQLTAGSGQACSDAYANALQCMENASCQALDDEYCAVQMDMVESACSSGGTCEVGEVPCDDGHCIPGTWQCDGDCDCSSCEDEDGCSSELNTEQSVVGAWYGSATCDGNTVEFGYILCPSGRLRGWESISDWDFICCGTWGTTGDTLETDYQSTAVADPSDTAQYQFDFTYDAVDDVLIWVASCPVVLHRLEGESGEDDCNTGTCSAGGTGDVQCNIDCDCGRCWYCESNVCRYGGEGPYGCYRGCS